MNKNKIYAIFHFCWNSSKEDFQSYFQYLKKFQDEQKNGYVHHSLQPYCGRPTEDKASLQEDLRLIRLAARNERANERLGYASYKDKFVIHECECLPNGEYIWKFKK